MVIYDPNNSKLRRALKAYPFLVLSVASIYCMDVIGLMTNFDPPSTTGKISWKNGSIPILEKFHWIPFFDEVFRDVTVGFAPSTLEYDPSSWWQMLSFLNDASTYYMVCLLEATRPANRWTVAYFPAVMGTIAQIGGGGAMIPLYFYLFLVYCPPISLQSSADSRIAIGEAFLWLPLMLVFSSIPLANMYFAPSFEGRHYWTWAWQLYTVRVTIGYYILKTIRAMLPTSLGKKLGYHTSLRLILGPFIAISVAAWINILLFCPYSFSTLFYPQRFPGEEAMDWVGMIRRCLQYDELFVFGSAFLWLLYLVIDMRKAGILSKGRGVSIFAILGLLLGIGPGATFGIAWLWRESRLVNEEPTNGSTKKSDKKGKKY